MPASRGSKRGSRRPKQNSGSASTELEAKRAEYEKWLKLREDFLKKAEDNVVEIYSPHESRMRQRSKSQAWPMTPRRPCSPNFASAAASAILNEMEPARAAHLADTLGGMRRTDDGKTNK